jgi:hypothetical protein
MPSQYAGWRSEVTTNEVLLRQHIAIIDDVATSPDGAWIAISNPRAPQRARVRPFGVAG